MVITNKKAASIMYVLGMLLFIGSITNNFVFDDIAQIVTNPATHSLSNIGTFFSGSTFFNGGITNQGGVYFRPLVQLVFSIIYILFGLQVSAYHIFQIILHCTNAYLLFLWFKKYFKNHSSLLLSLIFLIHPINSQSVYYISATQEILFFLFGMIALLVLSKDQSRRNYLVIGLCFVGALLSKETGVLFLLVSVVYTYLFSRKKYISTLGVVLAVSVFYAVLRIHALGFTTISANSPMSALSLPDRLLNIPSIIFFYGKTFLYPFYLSSSYQQVVRVATWDSFFLPLLIDLLVLGALIGLGVFIHQKFAKKYTVQYMFFGIWFFLGLGLHFQVLPLDFTVSESWFYFPIVGLLGMMGVVLEIYNIDFVKPKNVAIASMVLFILVLMTFYRGFDWHDEITLTMHDITVSKNDYNLESSMSSILSKQGKFQDAKIHAEKSIKLYPFFSNYNNLGVAYLGIRNYPKAKESYLKALQFGDYYITYANLAGLTLLDTTSKENVTFLKSTLKKFPQSSQVWLYLAILEYTQDNYDEAKIAITNAYNLDPNPQTGYVLNKITTHQPLDLHFQATK